MIILQKLLPTDKLYLKKVKKIYETSFPPNERRYFKKVVALLTDNRFCLFAITFENEVVGMLSKWDFSTFVYIEHFAISLTFRGNGLGSHILQKIMQDENRQIVLEVELPDNIFSLTRIKFYERFGFTICSESYIQPPYDKTKEAIPMFIMTTQKIDSVIVFQNIKKILYKEVYGFDI
jgi:ribosomal protein S18 acetylase RimI-like enzyme